MLTTAVVLLALSAAASPDLREDARTGSTDAQEDRRAAPSTEAGEPEGSAPAGDVKDELDAIDERLAALPQNCDASIFPATSDAPRRTPCDNALALFGLGMVGLVSWLAPNVAAALHSVGVWVTLGALAVAVVAGTAIITYRTIACALTAAERKRLEQRKDQIFDQMLHASG